MLLSEFFFFIEGGSYTSAFRALDLDRDSLEELQGAPSDIFLLFP